MILKAKISGVDKVIAALKAKVVAGKNVTGVVGFGQNYAIYVHENLEAKHPVGQAKYLEQPARQFAPQMVAIIRKAMADGKSLETAILLACLFLQREAQKLVPVDTGALKNSAFSRVETE